MASTDYKKAWYHAPRYLNRWHGGGRQRQEDIIKQHGKLESDTESKATHVHWTVCGVAPSVRFGSQIASVSKKLHRQRMYTVQKNTGAQWHANNETTG